MPAATRELLEIKAICREKMHHTGSGFVGWEMSATFVLWKTARGVKRRLGAASTGRRRQ